MVLVLGVPVWGESGNWYDYLQCALFADQSAVHVKDASRHGRPLELCGDKHAPALVQSPLGAVLHFTHSDSMPVPALRMVDLEGLNPLAPELGIAFWCRLDQDGAHWHNRVLRLPGSYELMISWGRVCFAYLDSEGNKHSYSSPSDFEKKVAAQRWYFIGLSHDGRRLRFFLNGKCISDEESEAYPGLNVSGGELLVGNFSRAFVSKGTFRGILGPLFIFNKALQDEEMFSLMEASCKGGKTKSFFQSATRKQ